ncbi:MAG: adenylate kinase [Eubacteriales bacterium]|nr:adenylate kinase [Eubacteriales bacterium]MDD3199961.1 adenylate kinase [Eubacteriales bacterium]MDD4630216.1 adenylate kinase [Eubacteriales bacterium]
MNLILLGPPGAGKGTQAVRISQKYSIPHISTGDIFRKNIKEGTELGKKAQEYMNKGELVPDNLVIEIAAARLMEDDCQQGFLLDGFPRTVMQAEELDKFLDQRNHPIYKVIDIDVDKEELMTRLIGRRVCRSCGATYHVINMPPEKEGLCDICGGELYQRSDDSASTVANRLEVYNTSTKPLIEYYERSGRIIHIDGGKDQEDVFTDIINAIGDN